MTQYLSTSLAPITRLYTSWSVSLLKQAYTVGVFGMSCACPSASLGSKASTQGVGVLVGVGVNVGVGVLVGVDVGVGVSVGGVPTCTRRVYGF